MNFSVIFLYLKYFDFKIAERHFLNVDKLKINQNRPVLYFSQSKKWTRTIKLFAVKIEILLS